MFGKLTLWVNSITFSDIFNVLLKRSVTYTDERRLTMKNSITSKDSSLSRRDFAILGIAGIAGAITSASIPVQHAFGNQEEIQAIPSIEIIITNGSETIAHCQNGIVKGTSDATCIEKSNTSTSIDNSGIYTTCCQANLKATRAASTKENSYEDLGATIKTYVVYTFFRGQLQISKAGVELSNVVENAVWDSRYLIAYQGPTTEMQTKAEPFNSLFFEMETGFSSGQYHPTGAGGMNGATFQGVLSAPGMEQHLVTAKIEF